jgi:hypothetical protein
VTIIVIVAVQSKVWPDSMLETGPKGGSRDAPVDGIAVSQWIIRGDFRIGCHLSKD